MGKSNRLISTVVSNGQRWSRLLGFFPKIVPVELSFTALYVFIHLKRQKAKTQKIISKLFRHPYMGQDGGRLVYV